MALPFIVRWEPPTKPELRSAVGSWRFWLAAAILAGLAGMGGWHLHQKSTVAPIPTGPVTVRSTPGAADVHIDGRHAGQTAGVFQLSAGSHSLSISKAGYLMESHRIDVIAGASSELGAHLWLAQPRIRHILPPLPGGVITDTSFLNDGRLSVTIALAQGEQRQVWLSDLNGRLSSVGQASYSLVAIARGGNQMAYLAPGSPAGSQPEIRIGPIGDGPTTTKIAVPPAPAGGNLQMSDLSWSPDNGHLVVVIRSSTQSGAATTRLALVTTASGAWQDLVSLPSDVLPGSLQWDPSGARFAFLTLAAQTSGVAVLDIQPPNIQYLANLSNDGSRPLPIAPVAWSQDGASLLFATTSEGGPSGNGWLLGAPALPTLYSVAQAAAVPVALTSAAGQSPSLRADGSIATLVRPRAGGGIVVRVAHPDGTRQDTPELAVPHTSTFAARWDATHSQALLAMRKDNGWDGGQIDYWLLQFTPEGA